MKLIYRGKTYDTEKPLEVMDLRDLGAYILMRYPSVPPNRMLIDRGYDGIIFIYLYTYNNLLVRDSIIHMIGKEMFTDPEIFKEIEKRIENVLLKRGFI